MARITIDLLRKRSEHNEGMLSTLEELALHQQHLEKIELLNKVCRHLKILLLQNNIIHKFENLHRMKDLQYLNVALNNISKIQNLQFCESLVKLDMTMNFVPKEGLLTVQSLRENPALEELYLLGNPCTDWATYRDYVVAVLPGLKRLDGHNIKPSDRIQAIQRKAQMHQTLLAELTEAGVNISDAQAIENDGLEYDSENEIVDPGYVDPEDGAFKRPWCPATRILEHRENEKTEREQEESRRKASQPAYRDSQPPRRTCFPSVSDDCRLTQRNEGSWDFSMDVSQDCRSIELSVSIGKHLDSALVQADVQPMWARLLIKGRLLQLRLPCQVHADQSYVQRSKATGALLLTMPRTEPTSADLDITCLRPKKHGSHGSHSCFSGRATVTKSERDENACTSSSKGSQEIRPILMAQVETCDTDDGMPPPL